MRPVLILGLILMAFATIAFVIGNFPVNSSTSVVNNDAVKVVAKHERIIEVPVVVDAILFLGGLAMVMVGARPRQAT